MGSLSVYTEGESVKGQKKRFVLLFNWIPESSVPWKAGLLTSVVLQALGERARSDG